MTGPSATRRFEFVEGGSAKFWEVTQDGASFTVRYGRIGSDGTAKTTTAASEAEATVEIDKLIRSKQKKGYQEIGAGATENWRPPEHISSGSHPSRFRSRTIYAYAPELDEGEEDPSGFKVGNKLKDCERRSWRVGVCYDDEEDAFDARIDALLADPRLGELRSLVIGAWFTEYCEDPPDELLAKLLAAAPGFGALRHLFFGDIMQEESEISWIQSGDLGPLLTALPALEVAVVRGHGETLRLTGLKCAALTHLTVQTGGMSQALIDDLRSAELPALKELVLWLGSDGYGNDIDPATLRALVERFPNLEHLGLQDAHNQDAVVDAVMDSPVIGHLSGLDFSMGTLGDDGAKRILACPAITGLKHLNLRHHYISDEALLKALRALPCEVDVSGKERLDQWGPYCEVSE